MYEVTLEIPSFASQISVHHQAHETLELHCRGPTEPRRGLGDLSGHECFASTWRFVIEENAIARKQTHRFPIVHRHPMSIKLRSGIWAAGIKRGLFVLRWRSRAEHFTAGGVVELRVQTR